MTKEDKELLLRDLSARLLYGVVCYYETSDTSETIFGKLTFRGIESFTTNKPLVSEKDSNMVYFYKVISIKPYLRPMSSMTEEEEDLLAELHCYYINNELSFSCGHSQNDIFDAIDWLLAHHFDYRGLIEKGLAIAVDESNNPYKE